LTWRTWTPCGPRHAARPPWCCGPWVRWRLPVSAHCCGRLRSLAPCLLRHPVRGRNRRTAAAPARAAGQAACRPPTPVAWTPGPRRRCTGDAARRARRRMRRGLRRDGPPPGERRGRPEGRDALRARHAGRGAARALGAEPRHRHGGCARAAGIQGSVRQIHRRACVRAPTRQPGLARERCPARDRALPLGGTGCLEPGGPSRDAARSARATLEPAARVRDGSLGTMGRWTMRAMTLVMPRGARGALRGPA
jgi:hypothetical protein